MMSLGPMRGRIAVARDRLSRAATLAGATGLTAGAFTGDLGLVTVVGAGASVLYGLLWSATLPAGPARDTATALYLAPSATMAGLFVTERLVPGAHWWELAADAAWGATVWFVRPARMARVLAGREPCLTPEAVQEAREEAPTGLVPAGDRHPMAAWWSEHVAVEGGIAPGTVLEQIELTGPKSMKAVIRSARPGTPVPTISLTALSALLDWDEEEITVAKISGRGAGVRRLTVGRAPQDAADLYAHWAQNIAPKGMPGTTITAIRVVDTEAGREIDA
ncbi:hypothetical protein PUR71_33230 [Streptomyces sp. SP17BM10]|uniref:hypothetical protein n=1 Tax=Streptomyces sp. SP17BM10 TaxID=3002530 RepID=UPI002E7A16EA|nr:hypothetical protein [Streptomyces sp. SP17BM10]MEE1787735.1 hypothetical protein [Streptomyces sp. SP17BM10]